MKKILIIVGHTGAGKSTICQCLMELYSVPLISFANVGKSFSNSLGYKRIRDCYKNIGSVEFKKMFSEYFWDRILECLSKSDFLIIDGLYLDDIAKKLKYLYETLCVYINVPEDICIKRVADRLGKTYESVVNEYKLKENLKEHLGSEYIISYADVTVDGIKDKVSVYKDIVELEFF